VDHCDECGFRYSATAADIPSALTALAARYGTVLTTTPLASLAARPAPETWSPLEYACHFRDILFMQRERLYQGLIEQKPNFIPMYREQRVTVGRYNDQSPAEVADAIGVGALLLGRLAESMDDAQWQRACIYNYPAPAERSLLWMMQHTTHEGEHHLVDIAAALG
jgi:hypothetical protein